VYEYVNTFYWCGHFFSKLPNKTEFYNNNNNNINNNNPFTASAWDGLASHIRARGSCIKRMTEKNKT